MLRAKSLRYYVLLCLVILLPVSACGPKYKATKARRQTERNLEQRRKEGERTFQQGQEQHQNIQSKETRKRMKQTRRQSERLNKSRKIPFYKRWYNSLIKR
jgi:hypothetical protein